MWFRSPAVGRLRKGDYHGAIEDFGRGQTGSALMGFQGHGIGVSTNSGVAASFVFFDRGTFGGTPVNLLLSSPKVPGRTFFPNPSRVLTFSAAAPLVLNPFVHNQTSRRLPDKHTQGTRWPHTGHSFLQWRRFSCFFNLFSPFVRSQGLA